MIAYLVVKYEFNEFFLKLKRKLYFHSKNEKMLNLNNKRRLIGKNNNNSYRFNINNYSISLNTLKLYKYKIKKYFKFNDLLIRKIFKFLYKKFYL